MNDKSWDFGFGTIFGEWPFEKMHRRHEKRHGRRQWFGAGEMKFVILRLLREKPRHGYEIIKALEEKTGGCYSPSAGTVYPTLQLLEDQGYVRIVEAEGKKVYHITPEGEQFLDQNKSTVDDIADRVKDAVNGLAGGAMGELNQTFGRLARLSYTKAWRGGPESDTAKRVVDILKRAVTELESV
jgi:DNA-binding PadR family transcriptional regulator